MLKFTLASRHMDGGTRERFFYEWSIIHVALMLTTPSSMRVFKRYVQHFNIEEATNEMLVYPLSSEQWESFAEHWLENYPDFVSACNERDYVERMQPHRFGSHRFITSLSNFETIYERKDFHSGGVKLIHFLKKDPSITLATFNEGLRNRRAAQLKYALGEKGLIRKYVQNTSIEIDPEVFKGSLFEAGDIGLYAAIEEFWFDDFEEVARLRNDPQALAAIRSSDAGLVDAEGSISMVVHERVVFDFVTPGEKSPLAAIQNPNSLEAAINEQGYHPWVMKQHAAAMKL
jgi:hypothetical protein